MLGDAVGKRIGRLKSQSRRMRDLRDPNRFTELADNNTGLCRGPEEEECAAGVAAVYDSAEPGLRKILSAIRVLPHTLDVGRQIAVQRAEAYYSTAAALSGACFVLKQI